MAFHICEKEIRQFHTHLIDTDLNPHTVKKYVSDICRLRTYLEEKQYPLNQAALDAYLQSMKEEGYGLRSINTVVAGINSFCRFMGLDLQCSSFRIRQKNNLDVQRHLTSEEYHALIYTAQEQGDYRMMLLIQVLAGTQLRVNELESLTVEALEEGVVSVKRAGEEYEIYIPMELLDGLCGYVEHQVIQSGIIFSTRTGKVLDRRNVWRNLKNLAREAGVDPDKVYPQNLKRQLKKEYVAIKYSDRKTMT